MASNALAGVSIRQGTTADAAALAVLAARTFVDTFGAENTEADMAMYVRGAFGEDIQRRELADPRNTALLVEHDADLVGYAILSVGPVPGDYAATNAVEIDRLYVDKSQIGLGLGAMLMQRCLDEAERAGHDVVWLNVWEHNHRAIRFYERWKFETVGTVPYILGTDHQTDFVMVRQIGSAG